MGDIIWSAVFNKDNTIGDKRMCKELIASIRGKAKSLDDMPERAQEVLDYFGITDFSKGVPIIGIMNKMGIKAYQRELSPEGLSAYISVDPKFQEMYGTNKIACVHKYDNSGHKRFALAHELAHYLFDFDERQDVRYYNTYFSNRYEETEEERRANAFAANLLMPEEEFRKQYILCENLQSKADTVTKLSSFFGVSITAVLKRFEELQIAGYDI